MKLYLLRHGESEYNVRGLCNDDPEKSVRLTSRGEEQALQAARTLSATPVECIFTSEFPRTQQTARIVSALQEASIVVDSRLNDRRTGMEGLPVSEYRRRIGDDPKRALPGGESYVQEKIRILGFLSYVRQTGIRAAAIVGHHEGLQIIRGYAEGLTDKETWERIIPPGTLFEVTFT